MRWADRSVLNFTNRRRAAEGQMMKPEFSKPFELAHAAAGALIANRHGDEAFFVAHVPEAVSQSRIIVRFKSGEIGTRRESGKHYEGDQVHGDLVMLPLGLIDGKPVFVGDELLTPTGTKWTATPLCRADRSFGDCRWPAPEKVYPKTQMDQTELADAALHSGHETMVCTGGQLYAIANAALRHACEAGQVVPVSEARPGVRPHNPYTGALRDPRDIETDPMGVLIRHSEELAHTTFNLATDSALIIDGIGPIYGSAKVIEQVSAGLRRDLDRAARDMAVAESVRDATYVKVMNCQAGHEGTAVRQIDLGGIIARVQA